MKSITKLLSITESSTSRIKKIRKSTTQSIEQKILQNNLKKSLTTKAEPNLMIEEQTIGKYNTESVVLKEDMIRGILNTKNKIDISNYEYFGVK